MAYDPQQQRPEEQTTNSNRETLNIRQPGENANTGFDWGAVRAAREAAGRQSKAPQANDPGIGLKDVLLSAATAPTDIISGNAQLFKAGNQRLDDKASEYRSGEKKPLIDIPVSPEMLRVMQANSGNLLSRAGNAVIGGVGDLAQSASKEIKSNYSEGAKEAAAMDFITFERDKNKNFRVKVPARFIEINNDVNNLNANAITRANNFQNRVLGRDFASQQPDQHRLARELVLEGYQYQLLRTDEDYSQTNIKVIDLDEALNALACLSKNNTIVATLKSNRGRFFENFEGSLYKTIFNPRLSGVKLINAVNHFRTIERAISATLSATDKLTHSRRHLIITHGNRYYASVLLNTVPNLNTSTDQLTPDVARLTADLADLIVRTENYIEANYPNAYPARFFANPAKIQELYANN